MEKIKTFQQHELNRIRKNWSESDLAFEKLGRSSNISDYSDREINEMLLGVYKDSKHLMVDEATLLISRKRIKPVVFWLMYPIQDVSNLLQTAYLIFMISVIFTLKIIL
ncbi:Uncharacterised protein [Sphingobacterium multivorum]|uniref:Uncharacterized protein n=1 Tax=Sphingobacterium multivorum TaxID=28454 RepID=A0A2X2JSY4_SPHMU|nr:hypothetical protein [Sphingobacterium multivorum]SPZ94893.1 Uncharacterised protein [Sphingobacterium multivorum]